MVIQSIFGLLMFVIFACMISENRKVISKKTVIIGLLTQIILAAILLKLPIFRDFFLFLNKIVFALDKSCTAGTSMVFGYLGGGALPFDEKFPGASFILAFRGLPLLIFMSAISSLLFYWKILPIVVKGFSWFMQRTFGIGGAEGVGVSANIFIGMVEAPLFIRPYLKNMTRQAVTE